MLAKIMVAAALAITAPAAFAQTAPAASPLVDPAEARLHTDWAWLARYQDANAALGPDTFHRRIVFMGDSITQGWIDKMPGFFSADRLDRGIGGQTTPQMLVRFPQDVIALHPAVVQIMGGTNDIAGNTGPMTVAQSKANIMAMADLARANGIRVILASIPPADHFAWRPGLDTAAPIAEMNAWLRGYARDIGATYADYWGAVHDGQALRADLTYDGVHPNAAGYAAMAPVAEAAIRMALARPAPMGVTR